MNDKSRLIYSCVILFLTVTGLSGDGPDDPSWVPGQTEDMPSQSMGFMSFFRVEYRTDVLDPDHLLVRVQVDNPVTPGVKRATVEMEVRIKGIDIPNGYPEWPAPFWQTDRHRKRNDDAERFVWETLKNTEVSWLANPDELNGYMWVDVRYKQGKITADLADTMIEAGHALEPVPGRTYDWSLPIVKLKGDKR